MNQMQTGNPESRPDAELKGIFRNEAEILLASIQRETYRMSATGVVSKEFISSFHTMGTTAGLINFQGLSDLAYAVNRWAMRHLNRHGPIPSAQMDAVTRASRKVQHMVEEVFEGRDPGSAPEMVEELRTIFMSRDVYAIPKRKTLKDMAVVDFSSMVVVGLQENEFFEEELRFPELPPMADIEMHADRLLDEKLLPEVEADDSIVPAITVEDALRAPAAEVEDAFEPELLGIFYEESFGLMDRIRNALSELATGRNAQEALQSLRRALHTIKAGARMGGAMKAGAMFHEAENALATPQAGGQLTPEGLAEARVLIAGAALLLKACFIEHLGSDSFVDLSGIVRRDGALECRDRRTAKRYGAIDPDQLERALVLHKHMGLLRGQISLLINELGGASPTHLKLCTLFDQYDSMAEEIHTVLIQSQLVPIGVLLGRFRKSVSQACQETGKEAHLDMFGDTRMDRHVIEKAAATIDHILRNAVAHGIEKTDFRVEAGKKPEGSIRIDVRMGQGGPVIEIMDDGAGIDRIRVRERAVELGLLSAEATPSDWALFDLIFMPGFSTVGEVSEVAGRGIGLDAARTEIESLGGSIHVESVEGYGTKFTIRLKPAGFQ